MYILWKHKRYTHLSTGSSMQPLLIAVETVRNQEPSMVMSAAWFGHPTIPNFDYENLDELHRRLIAYTSIHNENLEKAVNISIRRTLEKIYIRGILPTTDLRDLPLRAVLKPFFRPLNLCVPVSIVRKHWLITAARTLLKEMVN